MILGVGVDIIEIARVRALVERHGERFLERILTAGERDYCARRRDPAPHVAARFAGKEAVLKALGTGLDGGIRWVDVEIVRDESGPPGARLTGRAAEAARSLGADRVDVSLSHDRGRAIAFAVASRSR